MKKGRPLFFLVSTLVFFSFATAANAAVDCNVDTCISSGITTNTTWATTSAEYVVQSPITISSGVTLTIDPGVIVKFSDGAGIIVDGTLDVNGTSGNKVYFTAIKDDSVGGDTNGDGASMPSSSTDRWLHLRTSSGGVINIEHANLRYGGYNDSPFVRSTIYNTGGVVSISDSTIASSTERGIYQTSGTTTVATSDITIAQYGVQVTSGTMIIATSTIRNSTYNGIHAAGSGILDISGTTFTNNPTAASISLWAGLRFYHSGNTATGGTDNGFAISGDAAIDQTWTSDGVPYTFLYGTIVPSGKTLTIAPGAVLKFHDEAALTVNGTLSVQGSYLNPVYFTSIKDDSVSGDTNGNSAANSPAAGNWKHIEIGSGATTSLKHAVVRYGGSYWCCGQTYSNIYNGGGTLTIATSTITHGYTYGIRQQSGTTVISDSTIESNGTYGAYNNLTSTSTFLAINNYWGAGTTGPQHSLYNPTGGGALITSYISFDPWTSRYLLRFDATCIAIQGLTPSVNCDSVEDGEVLWGWHASSTQDYDAELDAAIATWNAEGPIEISENQSTPTVELWTYDFSFLSEPWRGSTSPPITGSSPGLIRLDTSKLDNDTSSGQQNTWTHEFGHSLGLAHHSDSANVMYHTQTQQTALGPQDISDYHYLWGY